MTEVIFSYPTAAKKLGISEEEYQMIIKFLSREPNFTELSVYSVMWSEHCSYKNSIKYLKKLPKKGSAILAEAGEENAGLVDIGEGWACAFKIESHNHPSAVEPYQGAATGVGGIHRDIFTMGARPIAALNSLRFGNLALEKSRRIIDGVVRGIGGYGNSFGVPTVAGEVYFDDCYNTNPLVNAMSVGLVKVGETLSATASGVGNPVFIVGAATGKDGIHGATFASEDLGADAARKLPSIQVGDPFQEKLLLEATLEAAQIPGAIIGMQDMGAAGIACSTSEMSARGKVGMRIDLDKAPLRQQDMVPFEILLSESQERMLVVVAKGKEQEVMDVFQKWDVNCAQIGEVNNTELLSYYWHGELVAEIPADSLVLGGGAPVYDREFERPTYLNLIEQYHIDNVLEPDTLINYATDLVQLPNICSKAWIYQQYDSMVQINNLTTNKPSDAAVIRIKNQDKALAMTVDCNPYYVYADPLKGTSIAVAEAARNLVCSGAKPLAVTNNLNFGNPYNKEVYYQFVNAIEGMSQACLAFDTPVTGGNVSFYNQSTDGTAVMPTPTIGMIGLVNNIDNHISLSAKKTGQYLLMIGKNRNDISSSQYLIHLRKIKYSPAPYFNLEEEIKIQNAAKELISNKWVKACHDVSEGGLFITLLEMCFENHLGFDIINEEDIRDDAFLFGESQSRIVFAIDHSELFEVENYLQKNKIDYSLLGNTIADEIFFNGENLGTIQQYKDLYESALEKHLGK